MADGNFYVVRLTPTAITTALTIIQLKAGAANGFDILGAKLYQITKISASELLRVGLVRKSSAATVTTAVSGTHIFKGKTSLQTTTLSLGTSATGVTATAEGTDTDEIEPDVWNTLNGSWQYQPTMDDRHRFAAAEIVGLKVFTAPGASMTIGGWIKIAELV